MSKEQDNINAISKVIDNGVDTFLEGVEKSQSGMFNKTLAIVKELETDINGNIKQTVKNLKLLTRVRKNIADEILTESYQKRVATFTNQYPAIQELNNGYFKSIEAAFNPNRELYNQIVQKSIQTTRISLLDSGIDQNVIEPIIRILDDSVSTGATFSDMVDELRLVMKGDAERLGKLMRYSTQITQDALNQFNGIYNETIAKDLDLEWYYYSGGRRKTSRPFCKKYAGRYFHKKEVEDFGRKKDLDGSNLCGGTSKTDLCQGRIPGTNASSIFRYRAGYNCKHIYKPTLIDAVPKFVINRNIKKGYFVPEGEEIEKPNAFSQAQWDKLSKEQQRKISDTLKETRQKQATKTFKPANSIDEAETFAKQYSKSVDYSKIDLAQANEVNKTLQKIQKGSKLNKISFEEIVKRKNNLNDVFVQGIYNRKTNEITLKSNLSISLSKRQTQRLSKEWQNDRLNKLKIQLKDDPKNSFLIKEIENQQLRVNNWSRENVGTTISDVLTHEYGHKIDFINKLTTEQGFITNSASDNVFVLSTLKNNIPKGKTSSEFFRDLVSDYAGTNRQELFAESYLMKIKGEKLPDWYDKLITKIIDNAD